MWTSSRTRREKDAFSLSSTWCVPFTRLSRTRIQSPSRLLHPYGALRVAGYAPGQQRIAWMACQGINEAIKGLEQVVAYLDDAIVFESDPSAHVKTIRALFERLRMHNLKLSKSFARLGATDADFLDHSISPAGVRPNADNVSALALTPMLRDPKQPRSLLGGLSYCRKFVRDMSKRNRHITVLLKKSVKFLFTPAMEAIMRDMFTESSAPPVLVLPDWGAVEDAPSLFGCTATPTLMGLVLDRKSVV